ncbi:MAG: agmatine deiminase [Thermodesulfobacteriota bacterium]|nr:MAG: agmatine deiminase [Thermodesulfobacteriota bacterium]
MKNFIDLNYSMPAEWEPHSAIWLAWPYDEDTFPDRVEKAEALFIEIIKAVHLSEQVELLVLNEVMKDRATELIKKSGADLSKIKFHMTQYADVWLRDTGPIFVKDNSGKIVITKWNFNSWGNKFPELLIDGEIPEKISKWKSLPLVRPDLVLEGGAIEINGHGVCLTTEQCLLNENRNPGRTKEDIEQFLQNYLGIRKTIWLKEGLTNDHTDGHIDELARFVTPNKIVCAFEDNEDDENYHILQENYKQLTQATGINGESFEIIKLPMPHMNYDDGRKAPVSYTNFYIGNEVILAAIFRDKNDAAALEILEKCFPDRQIIGIDCSDIIYGGGAVHCITQQEPAQ